VYSQTAVIKLQIVRDKDVFYYTYISHRHETAKIKKKLRYNESHLQACTVTAADWMMELCKLASMIRYVIKSQFF